MAAATGDEEVSGVGEEVVGVVSRALVLPIPFWVSPVAVELCSGKGAGLGSGIATRTS